MTVGHLSVFHGYNVPDASICYLHLRPIIEMPGRANVGGRKVMRTPIPCNSSRPREGQRRLTCRVPCRIKAALDDDALSMLVDRDDRAAPGSVNGIADE